MNTNNSSTLKNKSMNTCEKIEFLHKVHMGELSLWDENGNDNDIFDDFHVVQDELMAHPEWLSLEDILHIMKIFDDRCFEKSWQWNLSKIMTGAILYHGKSGVEFFVQNMLEVPEYGQLHGLRFPIQCLINQEESYSLLREVLPEQNSEVRELFFQILDNIHGCEEKRNGQIRDGEW